ncbi:MAG: AraC family transcriptional regulator [Lachnospiraceae bacterium]|nr:AraC family transcriptional regulator [Lachnospiraceae bacterium]MDE7357991.1 AraC family transcriptional regulator [Lachnospiraceae bacterium]
MKYNIIYSQINNTECIYYKDSTQSYPIHTHASHLTYGLVLDGAVCIVCDGGRKIYRAGAHFCILPDTPHAIETVDDVAYSMMCVCVFVDKMSNQAGIGAECIMELKKRILDTPEDVFLIEDMARSIGMSPYHMIRQFKAVCGLTPHQFQIQCRIRRGQKLLEEGKSVTEAAYATGFCDQSHFDRCFHRIVRLTPSAYKAHTLA